MSDVLGDLGKGSAGIIFAIVGILLFVAGVYGCYEAITENPKLFLGIILMAAGAFFVIVGVKLTS